MVTRSIPVRIFALLAAYALVLQALLLSLTPVAALAGNASSALAVLCTTAPGAGLPAGQDHPPCAPDCLMAGCGLGGMAPPDAAIAAVMAPAEIRLSLFAPIATLRRAIAKTPHIPRAPPLS